MFGTIYHMIFMDTKPIEKTLTEQALKLEHGDNPQKEFGQQVAAIAAKMKAYREANEHPITSTDVDGISTGTPKFQPRHLQPEQMRMQGKTIPPRRP